MHCYRHPKEETLLRCGKCEQPICTRCIRHGPAGVRCPDCSSFRGSPLYEVDPIRLALAMLTTAMLSGIGGFVMCLARGLHFMVIWGGVLLGGLLGELVLRITQHKLAKSIEIVTISACVIGLVTGMGLWASSASGSAGLLGVIMVLQEFPWVAVALVLTIFCAVGRVRFLR